MKIRRRKEAQRSSYLLIIRLLSTNLVTCYNEPMRDSEEFGRHSSELRKEQAARVHYARSSRDQSIYGFAPRPRHYTSSILASIGRDFNPARSDKPNGPSSILVRLTPLQPLGSEHPPSKIRLYIKNTFLPVRQNSEFQRGFWGIDFRRNKMRALQFVTQVTQA